MKNTIIIITGLILVSTMLVYAHVQNQYLPEGCGSCHSGHGVSNEPMLSHSEEQFCFKCHGDASKRSQMIEEGKLLASAPLVNMEPVFQKIYSHPIEQGFDHDPKEQLPNLSTSKVNHAECVDCHNPHQRIQQGTQKIFEVSGYSLSGQYLETSVNEYEVCFKCHVDITSVTESSGDVKGQFALTYASQHPVTKPSTGPKSASLSIALSGAGTMKCSDCHTNNNSDGPKGPHGSDYRFMLSGNYEIDSEIDESPFAYEFCYSCHDRSSILSNESFPLHREHIVGDPLNNVKGTSCYTCHASHSSRQNMNLIKFNRNAVSPDSKTGILRYNATGINSGECYINCHGHNHSPARY